MTFSEWKGLKEIKIDHDLPVEKWEYRRNNVDYISTQLDGRNLWQQTSFPNEDIELLKDVLLETFWRRFPYTFAKIVKILCLHAPSFAQSALVEASRQGQQDLLKQALTAASEHNYISDMIASSLIGNQLSTALWLIEHSGMEFELSSRDLEDLVKKSQIQRQKIFDLCLKYGNVDQIVHNIECVRYESVKSILKSDWNAVKHVYIQSHHDEPWVVRVKRKM